MVFRSIVPFILVAWPVFCALTLRLLRSFCSRKFKAPTGSRHNVAIKRATRKHAASAMGLLCRIAIFIPKRRGLVEHCCVVGIALQIGQPMRWIVGSRPNAFSSIILQNNFFVHTIIGSSNPIVKRSERAKKV